jgi:serine/threonine protein kinase
MPSPIPSASFFSSIYNPSYIAILLVEFVTTRIIEFDRSTHSEHSYLVSDLKFIAVLGSGTFGRVSLVQEYHSKRIFALKTMLKTEIVAHKQQNNVLNEKNIMAECDHPFVLRLFQTFKDARKLYMLFEFVQGGELFAVIHTAKCDGNIMLLLICCVCCSLSVIIVS